MEENDYELALAQAQERARQEAVQVELGRQLGVTIPRLVWLTNDDLGTITRVVNLASMILDEVAHNPGQFPLHDLDGDPVSDEQKREALEAASDAVEALGRAKWVPQGLETVRLMLLSD